MEVVACKKKPIPMKIKMIILRKTAGMMVLMAIVYGDGGLF
jgi:hypothetical protein